ncbi:MAG: ribonuclease E/G [Alphaproteobacteria bacterium]|nr:ribonuclease E/G [Alphaproteobacteria bacterium]
MRDCFFDRAQHPQQTGAIYQGTVDRILNGKGAFVKIPELEQGYLSDAEGLVSGQKIYVQVKNEARENKAVSLTKNVTLPGVFAVHQPLGVGVHLSRRLADMGEETSHLTKALTGKPGGWVIRSSAIRATRQEMEQEVTELTQAGQQLLGSNKLSAPTVFEQAMLSAAGSAAGNPLQVIIEKHLDLEHITPYVRMARPSLLANIRLTPTVRAFEQNDLDGFYDGLCNPIVNLSRGGNIKFERTDTMNVIDVNGGERTHHFEINRDAAQLVMNQIKWRNLGGIIIIDFLKMKRSDDRDAIADILDASAQQDATTCDVFGFTRLGLCEISRARRGYSLSELLSHA